MRDWVEGDQVPEVFISLVPLQTSIHVLLHVSSLHHDALLSARTSILCTVSTPCNIRSHGLASLLAMCLRPSRLQAYLAGANTSIMHYAMIYGARIQCSETLTANHHHFCLRRIVVPAVWL